MAYQVHLFGPFDVTDHNGVSIRPVGAKACGVLATLACSPNFSRTRAWLKAHFWSDRGEQQASASLRQVIWQIRKATNDKTPLLHTDNYYVSLDQYNVDIERFGIGADREFLEGIDVKDDAFEDWLRVQRAYQPEEILAAAGSAFGRSPSECAVRPGYAHGSRTPIVVVMPVAHFSSAHWLREAAEVVVSHLALGLHGYGLVKVVDLRETVLIKDKIDVTATSTPNFALRIRALSIGSEFEISVELSRMSDSDLISSNVLSGDLHGAKLANHEITKFVGACIEELHETIFRSSYAISEAQSMFFAICKFFSCSPTCQVEAREVFLQLQSDTGLAQAFLAYSYVVASAECLEKTDLENSELISAHCAKALEKDPSNPVVRAIVGHIYAFHFRDFDTADNYLQRARRSGRNNALVWSLSAIHRIYSGDFHAALKFAGRARLLGKHSPFRFFFEVDEMIAYSLTERHEQAVFAGERILARNPGWLSVMRHLAASYALSGRSSHACAITKEIQSRDPNYTHDGVASEKYPLPSPKSIEIIQRSFKLMY